MQQNSSLFHLHRCVKVACPECREECVIPDGRMGSFGGLQKNFFIGHLTTHLLSMNEMNQKAGDPCETCASGDKKVCEYFV